MCHTDIYTLDSAVIRECSEPVKVFPTTIDLLKDDGQNDVVLWLDDTTKCTVAWG